MIYGEYIKVIQFFRSVEDDGGKTIGYFGVQINFDTCLDLKYNNVYSVRQVNLIKNNNNNKIIF